MVNQEDTFSRGFITGLPVFFSYLPIAITFGLLTRAAGLEMLQTFSFSALVFAGASQFVALNLLNLGAGFLEIIITTFLVNLRHLLMSASLYTKIIDPRLIPILGFGVTDESFAVAGIREGPITVPFLAGLQLVGYLGWVGGTVLGYVAGEFLPEALQAGMGFALYALFIALIAPPASRSGLIFTVAIIAAGINWALTLLGLGHGGVRIVLGIIGGALAGTILDPEGRGLR